MIYFVKQLIYDCLYDFIIAQSFYIVNFAFDLKGRNVFEETFAYY